MEGNPGRGEAASRIKIKLPSAFFQGLDIFKILVSSKDFLPRLPPDADFLQESISSRHLPQVCWQ